FTVVLTLALRRRPDLAFAITVIGAVLASPVLRFESLSVGLVALLPWIVGFDVSSDASPAAPGPVTGESTAGESTGGWTAGLRRHAWVMVPAFAVILGISLAGPSRPGSFV